MKIAILYGGESPEREISIKSGRCVYFALKKKYKTKLFDPSKKNFIKEFIKFKPDFVFIALHGGIGESGAIQGFLETLKIPYTGSDVLSSALCLNKIICKEILSFNKIPTPKFIVIEKGKNPKIPFKFPVVVKPANLGSTIGVKIVDSQKQLELAIKDAFSIDNEVFVEKFIDGKEVTVGIIGNQNIEVLPIIEIKTKSGFYDYKAKYTPGESFHIIPPNLPKKVIKKIEKLAKKTYKVLRCSGFARMEIMVDKKFNLYVLDVNTIPGLTKISLFPDAAKHKGIDFEKLCEKLIILGLEKWKKELKS
ncbi:MAG: D-alanine--D-alanine ligase [bacterium]|nr:D-alanine--D-alanine ligase [bacterium]MCX7917376.1 D-alanine--D-alanine ligase [bacterium]MDW8164051.1 D-alanine--D-alanine ligase [Candidatus Omnitrophota bacterium]